MLLILFSCILNNFISNVSVQPEPEFRPPMSEVVEALVRLVQRTNMSKRTVGSEQGLSPRADNEREF